MKISVRHILATQLKVGDVDFATRGFHLDRPDSRQWLEQSAASFIRGAQLLTDRSAVPHQALREVEADRRGFAYEGAAMTAAILDAASLGRTRHLPALLGGEGFRYRHLIHVGVGWAMSVAKIPTPRLWGCLDPLLRWLAVDGAGFRQMFFDTRQVTDRIAGGAGSSPATRLRIQGAGRALWFVHAADVGRIHDWIKTVPREHSGDLWSGVGLAAAYAGDHKGPEAAELLAAAGPWSAHLAQGVVFGAAAHDSHGRAPDRVEVLLGDLLGIASSEAARWADEASRDLVRPGQGIAGYLDWQRRIQLRSADLAPAIPEPAKIGGHA